jgi:hypothetical protein
VTPKQARYALAAGAVAVLAGAAYATTRSVGPVPMTQFTEEREGGLAEHLVTLEQLGWVHQLTPHRYPSRVAPGLNSCVTLGFGPLYRLPDPQMAALPAESD